MNQPLSYLIGKTIKFAFIFYILFIIFSNFGTFLLIVAGFFLAIYLFIYSKVQAFKNKYGEQNNFHFKFEEGSFHDFKNQYQHNRQYEFNRGGINNPYIKEAKDFFGFESIPTKEELKKRYRQLAKKYHPDINAGDDTNMQKLNHYRDILSKVVE